MLYATLDPPANLREVETALEALFQGLRDLLRNRDGMALLTDPTPYCSKGTEDQ